MDMVIEFGSAVKALGDGKVGGYLVTFGDPSSADLDGEFFTKSTDFGLDEDATVPMKSTVLYNHALDATLKGRKLGRGQMKMDDVGVWIEAQLELRDDYERAVYDMARKGKLGWSSGTASHLVEKKSAGKATEITCWPLGLDASLTPMPADPRSSVITLKSWSEQIKSAEEVPAEVKAEAPTAKSTEDLEQMSQPEEMVSVSVDEQAAKVVSAAAELGKRLGDRHEARMKVGREFSQANVETLRSLKESIDGLWAKIQPPEEPEPESATEPIDGLAAEFELQQLMASLDGALFSC